MNANLLNGKGEITDVSLNCSFFNEVIATITPYIEFDSVHVSRLGFHVTSWANLRKAPIVVDIEHITATIHEPLRYIDKKHRKSLRILTEKELVDLITKGLCKPFRGGVGAGGGISVTPYGFLDRILDNLTIEMKSLTINYQTWGRFKTKRFGPWTPPCLQLQWKHLKIVSVDDYGNEGTPEEVWAHNRHEHEKFMLYKKISMDCTSKLLLRPQQQQQRHPSSSSQPRPSRGAHLEIPLFKGAQIEVQAAIQRRLRDGAVLSVQLDVTLPRIEIDIEPHVVPLLAHMAAGFQYCFAKDRTFEDPLHEQSEAELASEPTISLAQESMSIASSMGSDDLDDDIEDEEQEGETEAKIEQPEDKVRLDDTRSVDSADVDEPALTATFAQTSSEDSSPYNNRPIVMLPNGLIIYENICITMSMHHITVRGTYSSDAEGYVQLLIKGLIAEFIWPKVNFEMGCYGQLSLAYISLQERHGPRIRTILLGGMQYPGGRHHNPLEKASIPPNEVNADENFPFFERRSIREDPLGLRYSFPSQAVGIKTTADLRKSASKDGSVGSVDVANIVVNHEIGIDKFEIILDSDAWCRSICFALNEKGGGFDPRMHSGDWSDCMTRDMLLHPNAPLELENHLQSVKQVFLDENLMLSSDLLNITSRVTNLEIRIPAAVQENAHSCDILVKLDETILVVSSALPRTFLSGKIGTSINGDDPSQKAIIDFPNDPSDIAYALEYEEDPLSCQHGTAISKNASTFRVQLTMRGFSVTHIPVIPFCIASEPQQAVAPTDCNMIVCLEGEPPDEGSNLVKIVLFLSIELHTIQVNVDLDLLAGAVGSLLYHKDVVQKTVETARNIVAGAALANPKLPNSPPSDKVKRNLRGRRVMVRRQLSRSRETGGLSVVFAMKMSNFGFTIWRQNVPFFGPLRQSLSPDVNLSSNDESAMLRVLQLVRLSLNEFEVGIEFAFSADESRRLILKCCLGEGSLSVCDLNAIVLERERVSKASSSGDQDENGVQSGSQAMIDILSFGAEGLSSGSSSEYSDRERHFALRLEEQLKETRQWSLACDMTSCGIINLHVDQVKDATLLLIEGLLLPTWSKRKVVSVDGAPFPDRTVGAFFYSLVTDPSVSRKSLKDIRWESVNHKQFLGEADTTVERTLRVLSKLLLPSNLRLVLLRLDLGNLLICVPSVDDSDPATSKRCGLLIHRSEIILRFYPVPGTGKSDMLDVLACKGVAWSSLIDTEEEGFYQKLSSRQSLVSVSPNDLSSSDVLVNPFDVSLSYVAARISLSMDNDLLIEDMRKVEEFVWQLLCFREKIEALQLELADIFSAMQQSHLGAVHSSSTKMSNSLNFQTDKADLRRKTNTTSPIQSGRELMRQLSEEISQHDLNLRNALKEKESQVTVLKSLVFKKERERLGALSLLSAKVAGWVRMGGLHRTGERIEKISIMWPYWTVLRRSLLLLYLSPSDVSICELYIVVERCYANILTKTCLAIDPAETRRCCKSPGCSFARTRRR